MAVETPEPIGGRDGLESLVLHLVTGRIALAPVSLGDIVLDAEFFLGEVPTRDRLDAAIGSLVAGRQIGELPSWRFVDARSTASQFTHRRIGERSYAALFGQKPSTEAGPSDPAVSVSIPAGVAPTPDEWRRAEALAMALVGILQAVDRPARVMSIVGRTSRPVLFDPDRRERRTGAHPPAGRTLGAGHGRVGNRRPVTPDLR